jgi:hypothetical protein
MGKKRSCIKSVISVTPFFVKLCVVLRDPLCLPDVRQGSMI